jgi:peptidoglycan-N-acetylglucosamine deacetylase
VRAIALTFDDGPDGHHTPRLLDLLGRAGATATFFPIAPRATEHPGLVRRILREGHTIGVHCDEHVRQSTRDPAWCGQDADRALGRLRALGAAPALWRTPWGDVAPWTPQLARERGLRLVAWNVDTHDWRGDSAAAMFDATRSELRSGAIVLAHDGIGPGAQRASAEETMAYVQLVLEHARSQDIPLRSLA